MEKGGATGVSGGKPKIPATNLLSKPLCFPGLVWLGMISHYLKEAPVFAHFPRKHTSSTTPERLSYWAHSRVKEDTGQDKLFIMRFNDGSATGQLKGIKKDGNTWLLCDLDSNNNPINCVALDTNNPSLSFELANVSLDDLLFIELYLKGDEGNTLWKWYLNLNLELYFVNQNGDRVTFTRASDGSESDAWIFPYASASHDLGPEIEVSIQDIDEQGNLIVPPVPETESAEDQYAPATVTLTFSNLGKHNGNYIYGDAQRRPIVPTLYTQKELHFGDGNERLYIYDGRITAKIADWVAEKLQTLAGSKSVDTKDVLVEGVVFDQIKSTAGGFTAFTKVRDFSFVTHDENLNLLTHTLKVRYSDSSSKAAKFEFFGITGEVFAGRSAISPFYSKFDQIPFTIEPVIDASSGNWSGQQITHGRYRGTNQRGSSGLSRSADPLTYKYKIKASYGTAVTEVEIKQTRSVDKLFQEYIVHRLLLGTNFRLPAFNEIEPVRGGGFYTADEFVSAANYADIAINGTMQWLADGVRSLFPASNNLPVIVTAFRNPERNENASTESLSLHQFGRAVDMDILGDNFSNRTIATRLQQLHQSALSYADALNAAQPAGRGTVRVLLERASAGGFAILAVDHAGRTYNGVLVSLTEDADANGVIDVYETLATNVHIQEGFAQ